MIISFSSHRKAGGKSRRGGFTLIEISLVIVIVGIILTAAGLGWNAVIQGRRIAKNQTILLTVKDCLKERLFYSNAYPTFTEDLECGVNDQRPQMDFDSCICDVLDAWGNPIYILVGLRSGTPFPPLYDPASPDDLHFITNAPAQGQQAVSPDENESVIIDKDGNTVPYVAFVLISYGRDGVADDASYGGLLATDDRVELLPGSGAPPDFTFDANDDDMFIAVTGPEIKNFLTQ